MKLDYLISLKNFKELKDSLFVIMYDWFYYIAGCLFSVYMSLLKTDLDLNETTC